MKIAIVATYYERMPQLINTVNSLNQYQRDDFEFIVVDDASPHDIGRMNNNFTMAVIKASQKIWFNSCIPFNMGFEFALSRNPDIVIIQNAESYHVGDILKYAEENLTDDNYIAFPCYSLSETDTLPPQKINNRWAAQDGDSAWYNHPKYRPVGYHFCAAITANNLRKLNGMDERFMYGHDYEDNYWLHQVKSLGLRIDIPPEPFVYHQWHYSSNRPHGHGDNKALFELLSQENDYKALHIFTPDL